jgi:hypothetical protein
MSNYFGNLQKVFYNYEHASYLILVMNNSNKSLAQLFYSLRRNVVRLKTRKKLSLEINDSN